MAKKWTVREVVDLFGGATKTARMLGIKEPSVYEWIWNGKLPAERALQMGARIEVKSKGKITRKDLRPNDWHEVWPEMIEKQ